MQAISTLQVLGLTSSLVLSGVYFCASQLALPLLYGLPPKASTPRFSQLYHKGAVVIVPMILVSSAAFGTLAYLVPAQQITYGLASASTIAALVWTRTAMVGTIDRLCEISEFGEVEMEKVQESQVEELLGAWQWMNFVRSGLTLAGGLVAFSTLTY